MFKKRWKNFILEKCIYYKKNFLSVSTSSLSPTGRFLPISATDSGRTPAGGGGCNVEFDADGGFNVSTIVAVVVGAGNVEVVVVAVDCDIILRISATCRGVPVDGVGGGCCR